MDNRGHLLTTYLPHLVHVVFELPTIEVPKRIRMQAVKFGGLLLFKFWGAYYDHHICPHQDISPSNTPVLVPIRVKIEHHFCNKVIQKLTLAKNDNNKCFPPKLVIFNKKELRKIRMIFEILKVKCWHFLTACR